MSVPYPPRSLAPRGGLPSAAAPSGGLIVGRPERRFSEHGTEIWAWIHADGRDFHVGFRVPGLPVSQRVEPFLALALFPAMKLGLTLSTEAECSPLLLRNLESIQKKLIAWDRSLSAIAVVAPAAPPPEPPAARRGGAFFSGGVDSFHTLFRHFDRISDLIFVHGFDIPANREDFYPRTAARYEEAAQQLGKRLVRVWTNLRDFTGCYVDWGVFAHGPALAAVALLLDAQLERVLIPGEYFPADLAVLPRGSHPDTDPLWSTERMTLVHDGFDRTRPQKLGDIHRHPVVRRLLRVCWEGDGRIDNCCLCSKCLRNMAILRAYGVLDQFASFPLPLDLRKLARLPLRRGEWRGMLEETLAIVGTPRRDPALHKAIRDCLAERYYRGPAALARSVVQSALYRARLARAVLTAGAARYLKEHFPRLAVKARRLYTGWRESCSP